jgi:hypothetical protein
MDYATLRKMRNAMYQGRTREQSNIISIIRTRSKISFETKICLMNSLPAKKRETRIFQCIIEGRVPFSLFLAILQAV